jgi:hypothetical protein
MEVCRDAQRGQARRPHTAGGAAALLEWIAVEDIGAIATAVFADPAAFIGQELTLAGDTQSLAAARAIFKTVDGRAPFGVFMPAGLFGRMVSEDLLTMWYWLSKHRLEADVEATKKLHPGVMSMETWLRRKRSRKDGR